MSHLSNRSVGRSDARTFFRREYARMSAELRTYLPAIRYRLDRDALRFICETHVDLPTQPPTENRTLVLFAHFDPHGIVDPYVAYYLQELKRVGSTIIFVSGSPRLSPASVGSIRNLCAGIYTRRTLSLDFGSWHLAWNILNDRGWSLDQFDRFVLANDSVYGPLFPIEEMWSSFNDADMYGAIESIELDRHLQSFFLAWDLNSRTRPFLYDFWSNFRYIASKPRLIRKYEIGLSQRARSAGLQIRPYVSEAAARTSLNPTANHQWAEKLSGGPVNHTLYYWDGLIEHLRFPFLKTNLPRNWKPSDPNMSRLRRRVEQNLQEVPQHESITELREFIEERTSYPYDLIRSNLRRLGLDPLDGSGRS